MIWNHIPIEFACILFFALLIVVNLEMKENEIFGRINEKVMKYRYGECEKVYNGQKMYLLSILLAIAYFVIFILNFSFNEALGLLIALPYAVYVVTCILIVTIDLIFIQGTMKNDVIYKSEIYLGYKIEEIHLKNIYKQVTYKSFLYPKNSSGSGIKHYIEDEFGKHDADGWTIQQNDTSDSKYWVSFFVLTHIIIISTQ